MSRVNRLLLSLLAPFSAGFIGSLFTFSAIPTWYATLTKPSFSPPNWVFGPVWTTLYILMGIALYRIWTLTAAPADQKRSAITWFLVHLVFNALWSILFFGLHSPLLGLIGILILLALIIIVITKFYRLDRPAAYLLIPYLVWVTFATVLNFAIWQLN